MSRSVNIANKIVDKISIFENFESAQKHIGKLSATNGPLIISFINAHAFNLIFSDEKFALTFNDADLVFRDGVGMELLLKSLNKKAGANLNGTDLIPLILDDNIGKRIAILGTIDPFLQNACDALTAKGHHVVLEKNGFLQDEEYILSVRQTRPNIIIMGMGMPKQEKLSYLLKQNLDHQCMIINGGAIIDFLGNRFKRAPKWIRTVKLEWFYRFIMEPKRMAKRYLFGNFLFLIRIPLVRRNK